MTTVPTVSLNTPTGAVPIPQLGFGVWQVSEDEVVPSVAKALEVGYQHIDTAAMYGNERGVGQAIQDSGLGDNVWVTTKLNNDAHGFDAAMKAFDVSMDKLQRETLDLYLIHWPLPSKDRYAETWKAMQAMRDDGRITTIGVCNFQIPHLQRLYERDRRVPRDQPDRAAPIPRPAGAARLPRGERHRHRGLEPPGVRRPRPVERLDRQRRSRRPTT